MTAAILLDCISGTVPRIGRRRDLLAGPRAGYHGGDRGALLPKGVGMTSEDGAFRDLIRRVRAGDEAAAREVVRIYEPAIRREARVRLVDTRLRRMFDS